MNTRIRTVWLRLGCMWNCIALAYAAAGVPRAEGADRNWKAGATGSWHDSANWQEGAVPVTGDDVFIEATGASVLLTNSTEWLGSVRLSKTLVFTNWTTALRATNVLVANGGSMTVPGAFTSQQMSNRVHVVCSNMTIEAGGQVALDQKGYSGGTNTYTSGEGPGGGKSGGGYGGEGSAYGGATYGSASSPTDPGSGGYSAHYAPVPGRPGGGAARIEASGHVLVNGVITADGGYPGGYGSGSGSGGGIYITCHTFGGTNAGSYGIVRADAGAVDAGGGRIAVVYDTGAQSLLPVPTVLFSAKGSTGGDIGTLYFPDNRFLTTTMAHNGKWTVPGFTSWNPASLTVNGWLGFRDGAFELNVDGSLTLDGTGARLELGGDELLWHRAKYSARKYYHSGPDAPVLRCGGGVVVTNGAVLALYSGETNALRNYGAQVSVTNDIAVSDGSWVYPYSHPTNGGSAFFSAENVRLEANGGINASAAGYAGGNTNGILGYGPGRGVHVSVYGCGAGYGGGGSPAGDGKTYGSAEAPALPGSGGAAHRQDESLNQGGGAGGGLVRVEARGRITVDGTIVANGFTPGGYGGSGSGGGVYLRCQTFAGGASGLIQADGGDRGYADAESAGGGRIAVLYDTAAQDAMPLPQCRFSARGGNNGDSGADIGTVHFTDARFITGRNVLTYDGQLSAGGFTNWTVSSLTISNAWAGFRDDGFSLNVTGDLVIQGEHADFALGGNTNHVVGEGKAYRHRYIFSYPQSPTLTCGGDLIITNGGKLSVYSGPTNSLTGDYGALVTVGGTLLIKTNSWLYPHSHPTNGGSVLVRSQYLTIADPDGGIDASLRGYAGGDYSANGYGPGAGRTSYAGGGYGGHGGAYPSYGGATYGSSNAPAMPGSGGCGVSQYARAGGGVVRLEVAKNLSVNGPILANSSAPHGGGSAGSGGAVYIRCKRFIAGAGGRIEANGGNQTWVASTGGGGGRIAVWRYIDTDPAQVPASATAGTGNGTDGTVVWGWIVPPRGTLFAIR